MKLWKIVLTGSALAAMVFFPNVPAVRIAPMLDVLPISLNDLKFERPATESIVLTSRSPVSVVAPAQRPLDGIRIVVDPGHGGQAQWEKYLYCGGTIGSATGQTESDVNLRVALCLRQYLEAAGAEVIMTRISDDRCTNGGDKSDELDYRSNLANSRNADMFISVHHNEGTNSSADYTTAFYPSGMAGAIPLADNVASAVSKYLGTESIGARPGNYRVLKNVKMPGIIVEASFMSNPTEDLKLSQLSYNKREAKAIATGILNYVRMSKGRQVDFNTIFAPIDEQASNAQAVADASFVRKQIIEKRSLFGVRYAEVTYDAAGRVTSWRDVGSPNSFFSKTKSAAAKITKSVTSRKSSSSKSIKVADAGKSKKTSSGTKKVKKIKLD